MPIHHHYLDGLLYLSFHCAMVVSFPWWLYDPTSSRSDARGLKPCVKVVWREWLLLWLGGREEVQARKRKKRENVGMVHNNNQAKDFPFPQLPHTQPLHLFYILWAIVILSFFFNFLSSCLYTCYLLNTIESDIHRRIDVRFFKASVMLIKDLLHISYCGHWDGT